MRNDARPIGEDSPTSPVGGDEGPLDSERPDSRAGHKPDPTSPDVNRGADERESDSPRDPAARRA